MNILDALKYRAFLGGSAGVGSGGGAQPDMNAAPGEPGHILHRTHWKEEVPAIFDGDLTGREVFSFAEGMSLFKMSDSVLSQDELVGRTITEVIEVEDGVYEEVQTVLSVEEDIFDFTSEGMPVVVASGELLVLSVLEDTSFEGIPLKKGIYYSVVEVDGRALSYTKSLSGLTTIRYEKIPDEYIGTKTTKFVRVVAQEDGTYSVDITKSKLKFWVDNDYHVVAEYLNTEGERIFIPLSNYKTLILENGVEAVHAYFYGLSNMTVNNGCTYTMIIMGNIMPENGEFLSANVFKVENSWSK